MVYSLTEIYSRAFFLDEIYGSSARCYSLFRAGEGRLGQAGQMNGSLRRLLVGVLFVYSTIPTERLLRIYTLPPSSMKEKERDQIRSEIRIELFYGTCAVNEAYKVGGKYGVEVWKRMKRKGEERRMRLLRCS